MSEVDKDKIALKEEIDRLLYGTKYHTAKEWASLKRMERSHNKAVIEGKSLEKEGHICDKDLESNIAIDELESLRYELDFYKEKHVINEDDIKAINIQIIEQQALIDCYNDLKIKHARTKERIMSRREAAHLRRNNG